MSALYRVEVEGEPKGEVFKNSGRWRWYRPERGMETYHRGAVLFTVRSHVARLCRVPVANVKLVKTQWDRTT